VNLKIFFIFFLFFFKFKNFMEKKVNDTLLHRKIGRYRYVRNHLILILKIHFDKKTQKMMHRYFK
jgi:hypothetical protein